MILFLCTQYKLIDSFINCKLYVRRKKNNQNEFFTVEGISDLVLFHEEGFIEVDIDSVLCGIKNILLLHVYGPSMMVMPEY